MKRRITAAIALVALLSPLVTVRAQTATDEAARLAYEQGEAAFSDGDFEGAITAWQTAWELSHRSALLYNLALAAEAAGDPALAVQFLDQYVDIGENVDLPAITEWIATLQAQIGSAESEGSAADPAVVVDTEPTGEEGTAEGSGAGEAVADAPVEPIVPVTPPADDSRFGGLDISLTGLTATALAAGIGMGVATRRLGASLEDSCADDGGDWICAQDDHKRVDRERRLGIAADASFAVATLSAVGLVVSLVLDRDESPVDVGFAPTIGGGQFVVGGRF